MDCMTPSINAETLYTAFFEALSSNSYLIQTDAPRYTILAVTAQHLKLTGLKKEDVIGKGVAEVLLSNPIDYSNAGKHDFLASLHHILTYKEPHYLPVQRYDIADAQGRFIEKYWTAESRPVLTPEGDLAYIILTTEDTTDQVKSVEVTERMKGEEGQSKAAIVLAFGSDVTHSILSKKDLAQSERDLPSVRKELGQ